MDIGDWISTAQKHLELAGIHTARLDSLILLEDAMGIDRAKLLAYPETEIPSETQNVLNERLARRAQHEPLAYIRGKTEFYGRDFLVTSAVLEPRPESETMIDMLKDYIEGRSAPKNGASYVSATDAEEAAWCIADVGTGSGALGITAKLELTNATVDLLDISEEALEVANSNVIKFTSGNSMYKTDLLERSPKDYHILLCNLPYVPDEYDINQAAAHEPPIALFGGSDGLDLYSTLFRQVKKLQKQPLLILCESLPEQHATLKALAEDHGYTQQAEDDFIQAFVPANYVTSTIPSR